MTQMDLMTKAIKTSLLVVLNEVESCLDDLKAKETILPGSAINWGDLRAICAEFAITTDWMEGRPGIVTRVYIEEAAPNNRLFHEAIKARLPEHLGEIEIITEW